MTALAHTGVGIAGDTFDYRIIDRVISPLLGKGDTYSPGDTALPVPPEYYSGFAQWHRLSLMRSARAVLRDIAEVARRAAHPERLHNLIRLIEDGLGYELYQAVLRGQGGTVPGRSHAACASAMAISRSSRRSSAAISRHGSPPDIAQMAQAVDQALAQGRRSSPLRSTGCS